MGSATREATTASRAALAAAGSAVDLQLAEELFAAGRTIGSSTQLLTLLAERAGSIETKKSAIAAVFASSLGADTLKVLDVVAESSWSSPDDLLAGIEDLGIRAAAVAAGGADIEGELFAIGTAVTGSAELELALGSKLGDAASKGVLVDRLFSGKVSAPTLAIVKHLVQQPRGRRVGKLVSESASTVAQQGGQLIATVTSAAPLKSAQLTKLTKSLSTRYGTAVKLNTVTDPSLVGGVRIQIGDDVIDGSIATRLSDLRLQLAG